MDEKIVSQVKGYLFSGKSKEEIYKELLGQNYKIEDIESALNFHNAEIEKEDTQKKTIRIILTIAAILVGVGIFSFIASNWQLMGKTSKVLIILLAMCGSYATGFYIKEKSELVRTGEAFILLGSIIYGAGIFLVGQMFNIRAGWPDGFILWMLGTIAMGYSLDDYSLLYLAIPLGVVAIAGHPFGILGSFSADPLLLTSSILLVIATVTTFLIGLSIYKRIPVDLKEQ